MAPYKTLERADNVRNLVSSRPKISITDLSRGKEWREQLPKAGVMEITDRGDTAGWLLSDEDMSALIESYAYLEEQLERAQIAALFDARKKSHTMSGDELKSGVLESFEARRENLRRVIDGD